MEPEKTTTPDACTDGIRLQSIGATLSYNRGNAEAQEKHTLLEIATRLRTGFYAPKPAFVQHPTAAPDIITKAVDHMRDRAATYDKPEGERSMAQTVAIFNLHHGTRLTEAQGWHFQQVLKDVRLFSRAGYHADSAEDCVAYAGLKAEAKAKEVHVTRATASESDVARDFMKSDQRDAFGNPIPTF